MVQKTTSCPLDSSSSPSSLSNNLRSSTGSDIYQSCDETDDPQGNYDVPPLAHIPMYDVPNRDSRAVGGRFSGGSNNENGNGWYDFPPTPQSPYDILPPPSSRPKTVPGMNRVQSNTGHGQNNAEYENDEALNAPPTLQHRDCDVFSAVDNQSPNVYDIVPSRNNNYDTPPFRDRSENADISYNYDYVPAPKPLHGDGIDGDIVPPVATLSKPVARVEPYVNVAAPYDDEYKKPLPRTPYSIQRDSGTDVDEDDPPLYDIPPVQCRKFFIAY